MHRILAFALLASCGSDSTPMNCPPGETCSDMYPDLAFQGSRLGENDAAGAPLKLGVNGTQKIKVLASPADTIGILSFRAASTGTSIITGQLLPPNVTLLGNSQGTAYLRILAPATGQDLLFGRTLIEVVPVASTVVRPKTYQRDVADKEFADDKLANWVLYSGGTEDIVTFLLDSAGTRVADEGVFLGVSGPPLVLGSQSNWDTVSITASPGGGSQGMLKIRTSDTMSRDQNIDVVTTVEQIIRVNATNATMDPSTPAKVGDLRTYCFRAVNGGRLVAGVAWTFLSDAMVQPTTQAANCVTLKGTAAGTDFVLTVKAANQFENFTLTFTP